MFRSGSRGAPGGGGRAELNFSLRVRTAGRANWPVKYGKKGAGEENRHGGGGMSAPRAQPSARCGQGPEIFLFTRGRQTAIMHTREASRETPVMLRAFFAAGKEDNGAGRRQRAPEPGQDSPGRRGEGLIERFGGCPSVRTPGADTVSKSPGNRRDRGAVTGGMSDMAAAGMSSSFACLHPFPAAGGEGRQSRTGGN